MPQTHDASYKLLFSHQRMVADLLRGFLPLDWVAALDLDCLERLETQWVGDHLEQRRSDIVWRVRWGPQWLYVVILIEFQSTEDSYMALRINVYVSLLYQELLRSGQIGPDEKLPPVLPIVLYNGQRPWRAATDLGELIAPAPAGLEPYQPSMRYLLIDEGRYSDAELAGKAQNLVAALFRLEKGWPPQALLEVLNALREWLRDPAQQSLQRAFTEWLKRVWSQPRLGQLSEADWSKANSLLEVRDMLAERINAWTEEIFQKGVKQGLQQGREQSLVTERRLLVRQARRRFGAACAETLAGLLEPIDDPERLAQIGEWLIDSADGESFLASVRAQSG